MKATIRKIGVDIIERKQRELELEDVIGKEGREVQESSRRDLSCGHATTHTELSGGRNGKGPAIPDCATQYVNRIDGEAGPHDGSNAPTNPDIPHSW